MKSALLRGGLLAGLLLLGAASCTLVYGDFKLATGTGGGTGTGGAACSSSAACAESSTCPAPASACVVGSCDQGCCTTTNLPQGTTCSAGQCDGHGSCAPVVCTTVAECAPSVPNPCVIPSCSPAGTCVYTNLPDGTANPAYTPASTPCQQHVCVNGMDALQEDDANLPSVPAAMAGCADAACTMGAPSIQPRATDSPCSTYMGSEPGFCDAAGSCAQCTKDNECSGSSDDCGHPACASNACTMVFTAAGTATSTNPPQAPGTCQQIVCDGKGGHMSVTDNSNAPSSGTPCITDSCSSGSVVMTDNPGVTCGAGETCTASGQCGCQSNSDCTLPQTCGGGGTPLVCGCTPQTCANQHKTCGGPFSDLCTGMINCNDATQDGTETDVDCGGVAAANSTCNVACAQGKKCNVGSDCQSGSCADGVCCNTPCTGTCQACSAAAKGQGSDGVCGAVSLGQDPHHNCSTMGVATCGESGGCNGSGACSTYPSGDVCVAASCAGTILVRAESCANGACTAPSPPKQDCSPYLCSGGACTSSCKTNSDCAPGDTCALGHCMSTVAAGGSCTNSNQCSSGICGTNSVCCAGSCIGSAPCGTGGACAPGTGACMYAPASTSCSDQSCAGGVVTSYSACDGMGNCEGNESMSICPNNLGCQGTGCAMVCGTNDSNGDALCATGYWCNGLMCLQALPPSSPCSRGTQCTSGNCSGTCQ